MNAKVGALRPITLALSLATFLVVGFLACLALSLIVTNRGLHTPWLQFFVGFSWTWQGVAIGLLESVVFGLVGGGVFALIYNFYSDFRWR
jgi:hypothetical protein